MPMELGVRGPGAVMVPGGARGAGMDIEGGAGPGLFAKDEGRRPTCPEGMSARIGRDMRDPVVLPVIRRG